MRIKFSTVLISSVLVLSACSTVPKSKTLMQGIDVDKSSSANMTKRSSTDPVCTTFYSNVIEAARKSANAKRTNSQMLGAGVSIGGALAGIGPVGSVITNSAARVLLNRTAKDVSNTEFDPEKKFDKPIIEAADGLQCPIRVKGQATP